MLSEFAQEVKNSAVEILNGVHTAIPGKIVKYDPAKCEAEVLPYCKIKKPNGEFLDYPQLNHVPVLFQQSCGQDFTIVYPVNPGDECLILAQEQTLDIWRGAGASSDNSLRFDLTNAIAIIGLYAKPQKLAQEAQDNDALIIQKNDHRLHIKPDEVFLKYSDAVNIKLNAAGITITAPTITLAAELAIAEVAGVSITETAGANITETAPTINQN
ncbi:hypothetical protein AGMMS49975_08900 [Clostridia bacterium]|nr:hypothetical protein AGMMS49975_08900 [Clostridia bacterium]